MRSLGCFILLLGVTLLWGGGQGLYTYWASGDQKTVSYSQLIHDDSTAGWYKLTDASWKLADAVVLTGRLGLKSDFYVPVEPLKGEDSKIRLLVHVVDAELAQALDMVADLPEDQQAQRLQQSEKLFFTKHPVDGLLEFGIESDDKELDAVTNALGDELATDYRVIELGAEPGSPWGSLVAFCIGLLIFGAIIVGMIKGGDEEAAEA